MIKVKVETDPATFRRSANPFLLERPSANQLVFDLAQRIESFSDIPSDRIMWIAIDDIGKIHGVALRTDPKHSLILSEMGEEALGAIVDGALAIEGLDGVLAVKETAQLFQKKWGALCSKPLSDRMHLRLYDATSTTPPAASPGHSRVATSLDLELLSAWSLAFARESLGSSENDLAPYRKDMEKCIREGREWVWEVEGEVCAMAVWTGKNELGTKITGVYTPVRLRGRGFASNLVCMMTERLLADGAPRAFIFTDLKNPTSNSIYQNVGYKHVCDFIHFGIEKTPAALVEGK